MFAPNCATNAAEKDVAVKIHESQTKQPIKESLHKQLVVYTDRISENKGDQQNKAYIIKQGRPTTNPVTIIPRLHFPPNMDIRVSEILVQPAFATSLPNMAPITMTIANHQEYLRFLLDRTSNCSGGIPKENPLIWREIKMPKGLNFVR